MKAEPNRLPAARGRAPRRALLVLLVLLPAGGCRFLADEFTWLDRASPAAIEAPDAPVSGGEAAH
jgi:hypothetical protein